MELKNNIEMYKEDFKNHPNQNTLNKIQIMEQFNNIKPTPKPDSKRDPNESMCVGTVQKPSAWVGKSCDLAYSTLKKNKNKSTADSWCGGGWNKGCTLTTPAKIQAQLKRRQAIAEKNLIYKEISDVPIPDGICSGTVRNTSSSFNNQSCGTAFKNLTQTYPNSPDFGKEKVVKRYDYYDRRSRKSRTGYYNHSLNNSNTYKNAQDFCKNTSGCQLNKDMEKIYLPDSTVKDLDNDEDLYVCKASGAALAASVLLGAVYPPAGIAAAYAANERCSEIPNRLIREGNVSGAVTKCNRTFGCSINDKALDIYKKEREAKNDSVIILQNKPKEELYQIHQLNEKSDAYVQDTYRTNVIIDKQAKEIDFSEKKLNEVKEDSDTVRRQVEISENETLRKNSLIFRLKVIFIFIMLACIPAYLMKIDKLSQMQGTIVIGVISFVLFVILLKNFINNRYNNPNNLNVQLWTKPDIQEIERKFTKAESDKKSLQDKLKNMTPLDKLEFLLSENKKTAINNENYAEAGHYDTIIKSITNKLAGGDRFGGFGSDQGILAYIDKMNSDAEKLRIQKQLEIQNNEKMIQNNIQKQQSQIKNLQKSQRKNANQNKQIQQSINKINNSIVFEENQLNNLETQEQHLQKPNERPGFESEHTKSELEVLKNFKSIGSM